MQKHPLNWTARRLKMIDAFLTRLFFCVVPFSSLGDNAGTANVAGTSQMGNAMTDDVTTTIQIDNARTRYVAACPPADVLGIM
jgi:hypothetical protein